MRVAFLEGLLAGNRLPFLRSLRERVSELQVCVTGPAFDLRESELRTCGLDISRTRAISVDRALRHPLGVREEIPLDLPWNVLRVLGAFSPEVVISSEMGLRTLQAAVYRRLHPASRLVIWAHVSEHSEAGRGAVRTSLRKVLIRQADAIVTNGTSGRRYLIGKGADPARVHVVHPASALAVAPRRKQGERNGPLRLLSVSRLVPKKGLHLLLPVLARYLRASWRLTIAGDGPEWPALEELVSRYSLPVEFAGFVPRYRLPWLFACHDVFVFPTLNDEWGLVVGEALRAGLPVAGSIYSDAVRELVTDGTTGWLMVPDRPETIAAALDRVFSATDDDLMHASQRARDSAREETPEAMADQFHAVLRHASSDGAAGMGEVPDEKRS